MHELTWFPPPFLLVDVMPFLTSRHEFEGVDCRFEYGLKQGEADDDLSPPGEQVGGVDDEHRTDHPVSSLWIKREQKYSHL